MIPADEYLIVRFTTGTDDLSWSDGDIALIYAGGTYSSLNDTRGAISLYNSDTTRDSTTIVDFVAYGADPGANDADAVAAGLWDDGDFVLETVDANETIGRDKNSTDTNQPADWDDTGGPDAQQATYGYQNFTNVFAPAPTAVTLSSFTATGHDGHVLLEWETASEIDNDGFNIWRAKAETDPYTKLNADPIPAQGGPTTGASYSYDDEAVTNGVTYWYKLEDVDTHGASIFHGPVAATPQRLHWLYLPLLLKGGHP